jgi:hypothetical protein
MKIGLIALSGLLISSAHAEMLEEVRWGMDIEENVSFTDAKVCDTVVREVLQENGFIPKKTGYYEQGPTIFSESEDKMQKSIVKCMLSYDLVITAVIGQKENLQKAEQINESIKNRQQTPPVQQIDHVEQAFTHFGLQQKIPAPHGHIIYAEPTLKSAILKQVAQPDMVEVVGYVTTEEGRFYVTQYSWTQYQAGKDPNWIYINP